MPFDAYSRCPAGTGKKVKFCCPNNWQDLEKINRLIEGEQFRAALQLVDQLLAKQPNRACLWAYKTVLERANGSFGDAVKASDAFLSRFPDNPVALAERVITLTLLNDSKAALPVFEQSLQASYRTKADLTSRQIEALLLMLRRLHGLGEVPPIMYWITWLENHLPEVGSDLMENKVRIMGDAAHPLPLREPPVWIPISVPEDTPAEYRRVAAAINGGLLNEARRVLGEWLQAQPEAALPWYLLGMCSLWQADYATAGESFLRYGKLTADEDMAVAAKVLSYHLKKDPWGDAEDNLNLTYALPDPTGFKEAVLSDRRVKVLDRGQTETHYEDGPPPELVAVILRHESEPKEWPVPTELKNEAVAILAYFGRQTDRDARVLLNNVTESDQALVEEMLRQWLGDRDLPAPSRIVNGRRSQLGLALAYVLQAVPEKKAAETFRRMIKDVWADRPNKALDDLTPRQAAADPGKRRALKAVLHWMREFDFPELNAVLDELKAEWGLQDVAPRASARMEGNLCVPLTVAARTDRSALTDDDVRRYCSHAIFLGAYEPARFFAEEAVARRERLPANVPLEAYRFLISRAEDAETAKRLRDEAVEFAEKHRRAHGVLHLALFHSGLLESQDARAELTHMAQAHGHEPPVQEFLEALMQFVAAQEAEEKAGRPDEPKSQGLWTPDGEIQPGPAEPQSQSKLWIPGRD